MHKSTKITFICTWKSIFKTLPEDPEGGDPDQDLGGCEEHPEEGEARVHGLHVDGRHAQQEAVDPGGGHPWKELFRFALKYRMCIYA